MTAADWNEMRDAYVAAARWFEDTVAGATDWAGPGLGDWTLRDLVGHTTRALLTLEGYLATPATVVQVESATDYFRVAMASLGDPAAVLQRGRDAGTALGERPAATVTQIVARVLPLLDSADPDQLLTTPVGGMRLLDYLPTRVFELTVHTCDIAAALGRPVDPPVPAAKQTLALATQLATGTGKAGDLMLALTGRRPLPAGFSVL